VLDNRQGNNLRAKIVMEAHKIEKAFSLPSPRSGFGRTVIPELIHLLEQCAATEGGSESLAYKKARSVLGQYLLYHKEINFDLKSFGDEILPWADIESDVGGFNEVSKGEWLQRAKGSFKESALGRSSVRSYSGELILEATIQDVIRIASKTPSVCNRQTWHTYIVRSKELKEKVMNLQSGCFGFGDTADFLAVITSDICSFVGAHEKNQSFVDGGMYAMSFLYALHSQGLGACPLHWMVPPKRSQQLRNLLSIPMSKNIVMVISVGNLPENIRTAKSVRYGIDEQYTIL
jgi:nitroreductase